MITPVSNPNPYTVSPIQPAASRPAQTLQVPPQVPESSQDAVIVHLSNRTNEPTASGYDSNLTVSASTTETAEAISATEETASLQARSEEAVLALSATEETAAAQATSEEATLVLSATEENTTAQTATENTQNLYQQQVNAYGGYTSPQEQGAQLGSQIDIMF